MTVNPGFQQFSPDTGIPGASRQLPNIARRSDSAPYETSPVDARRRIRSARHRRPITEVAASHLHDFYSLRTWQSTLVITAILLCYAGGGAMFYLHAIVMGEQGPAIAPVYHWLLDSTLGFIALTPALFFLIPATHHTLKHHAERHHPFAIGAAFAIITAPGPIIHDETVGRGSPGAQLATNFFGRDTAVINPAAHIVTHTVFAECGLQVLVGLPVYIFLSYLAFDARKRLHRAATHELPHHPHPQSPAHLKVDHRETHAA
jgi:hypothetical protein